MRLYMLFAMVFLFLGFSSYSRAEKSELSTDADQVKESELAQKAKRRQYPGGRDESDLKVQTQLTQPVRKMAPTLEDESEEPTSND